MAIGTPDVEGPLVKHLEPQVMEERQNLGQALRPCQIEADPGVLGQHRSPRACIDRKQRVIVVPAVRPRPGFRI